jgi:hypothetical protein
MGTLEAGGEPTSRGKATARAQGKAQRLPALHLGHQAVDRSGAPRSGQLSLCLLKDASRKRSLIGQDTIRIRQVVRTGISVPQDSKNLMLMNENTFVVPADACHRAGEAGPVGRDDD